ncbi:MAG: zf-HC2 domain-containing protein [Anaerolineaceae bacterium]|nr:zf-HC2 domain-containing protein [Anaerolineaceae bacterium]
MECQELIKYLSDYIDNRLDEDLTRAAQEHLATCHNCHVVLDSTQKTILLYRQYGQETGMTQKRHESLYNQIAAAFSKRPESDT